MGSEWPPYWEDPLIDPDAHLLEIHPDPDGRTEGWYGACVCREWTTQTTDEGDVKKKFNQHMKDVQALVHSVAAKAHNSQTRGRTL
ncbi:hypothetical protein [Spongiactinospora gelatinilytica]|uniref:hypothetical protein n=1 Tax=Spongiactinospora gelatinilytica TaxID=2666298 RepID=UPI0011B935DF|nr:hypothetical protein [Spongiactinospora gelatinilytica]